MTTDGLRVGQEALWISPVPDKMPSRRCVVEKIDVLSTGQIAGIHVEFLPREGRPMRWIARSNDLRVVAP